MNTMTFNVPTDRRDLTPINLSNILESLLIDNKINDDQLKVKVGYWLANTSPGQSQEAQNNSLNNIMKELKSPDLSWPRFLDAMNIIGYPTVLLQV